MAITQTSKTVFLRQLVADIEAEKIGIPVFQRSYVWTEEQVLSLFDSINKGYPIGAILLWGREEKEMKRREFLSDRILNEKHNVYYVLDGRQRLTTFYGCISKSKGKRDIFNLAYNLKEDSFEFPKKEAENDFIIQISEIFDTFSLIEVLQKLSAKYSTTEKRLNEYLNNAKRLNSKLQEYQIVQISLDYCSLDEANIVFSRINSRGTDIKKAEMLQAVNYKDGSKLLADEIQQIQEELTKYNFENLSQDDILNCFFKFVNKDFYSLTFKEMETLNLIDYVDEVRQTIIRTADFLYRQCGIIDGRLLPYARQFIILTFFFKEHKNPETTQLKELRKWFFYTTFNNSFQNGSIAYIRNLARRFEAFVSGKEITPIDYQTIDFKPEFDFRISLRSAKSKFLILSMLNHYKKIGNCTKVNFEGLIKFGGSNSENYFVLTSYRDKEELTNIFIQNSWIPCIDNNGLPKEVQDFSNIRHNLSKFGLSIDMLSYYFNNNTKAFKEARWKVFLDMEKELWTDIGGYN